MFYLNHHRIINNNVIKWGLFVISLSCFVLFGIFEKWYLSRDGIDYLRMAEEAQEFYYFHEPVEKSYPPLLIIIMLHFKHWLYIPCRYTGLVLSLFSGAMCPVIVYSGVYKIFQDNFLAVLSGLLFLLIPSIRDVSVCILRDAPSLCMNLAGIYAFICYQKYFRYKDIFLSGLFFALATAFRYENIEFVLIVPCLSLALTWNQKKTGKIQSSIERIMISWGCFALAFVSGSILVALFCFNTDYYSYERILQIPQKYFYESDM